MPNPFVLSLLTPLELIERIAALVPPPRTHRHRYYGVLAPNSPLRASITALAQTQPMPSGPSPTAQAPPVAAGQNAPALAGMTQPGSALPTTPEPVPPKRPPARYLWAVLIARIYEVFPLLCRRCQPVGCIEVVDRLHLRGVPSAVPHLRRSDAHHRVHHTQR